MISMILLIQHLVEATAEDDARPKVTEGPTILLIKLPQQTGVFNYRAADQESRPHSWIQLAIEE